MIEHLFLCYRRSGAQTAKLFKRYIERHHIDCEIWYSDLIKVGNFKDDVQRIYDADGVLIFVADGFVDNFLDGGAMECITAAEIKMIAKKRQDCPDFKIVTVNLNNYSFSVEDESVLIRLFQSDGIRDPKASAQQIVMCNHNPFLTATDDEDAFFEELVKTIFPERAEENIRKNIQLPKYMDVFSNENAVFSNESRINSYYWGADKTLLKCANIFEGWDISQIIIDDVDTSEYCFPNEDWQCGLEEYLKSGETRQIIQRGNNKTRWMISEFETSYETGSVFLHLRKTNWCTNQYVWKRLRENEAELRKYLDELEAGNSELLPNSFCLHLVIFDRDDKVLLTRVSRMKKNDYPETIAATIGEQIEFSDFADGDCLKEQFLECWVERAILEEFGITKENYPNIVDTHSICPLALTVEGDIYNIALVTSIKLRYSAEELIANMNGQLAKNQEFREIIPCSLSEIPMLLAEYHCKQNSSLYHPSTFLRLFLCYIHRKGTVIFEREYRNALERLEKK